KPRFGSSEAGFCYWTLNCPWRSGHILNRGPEEKAPPKRGLKCTGIYTSSRKRLTSAAGQFATRELFPERKTTQMTGLKTVMHWGYGRVTQSKPHPFTFAGHHVQIGAGYNSLGHDSLCADRGRAQPRSACRPHSRRVGALRDPRLA